MTVASNKAITVNRNLLFRMINVPGNPTIVTHNIAKGWDDTRVDALEAAVYRLADRNPILSGILHNSEVDVTTGKKTAGVFVEPHKFQRFVHYVEPPKDIPSPATLDGDTIAFTKYVQSFIEPLIPSSKTGTEEIQQQLPVFGVHVMRLPDGYVYYAPRLSHQVGDGTTYYQLVEELNAILLGEKLPPPIVWGTDGATSFDLISPHQVRNPLWWLGTIVSAIIHAIYGFGKTQQILLSQRKIQQKKKELAKAGSHLSTNDIVTAALSSAISKDYDYSTHAVNYRAVGRCPGVGPRDGGNVTRLVPYALGASAHDPSKVRELTDSLARSPNRDAPLWSMLRGRGFNQTNWANLQCTLEGTVIHGLLQSLVDTMDVPLSIVYQPNDEEIGIMHKFKKVNVETGLLSEILTD